MLSTCRRPQTCPHARWKRLPPSSFSHLSSGTGRQARRGDAVLLARQSLEDGKLVVELVQVLTHSTGTEKWFLTSVNGQRAARSSYFSSVGSSPPGRAPCGEPLLSPSAVLSSWPGRGGVSSSGRCSNFATTCASKRRRTVCQYGFSAAPSAHATAAWPRLPATSPAAATAARPATRRRRRGRPAPSGGRPPARRRAARSSSCHPPR